MIEKVLITVIGTQKIGDESDKIELTTVGSFREKDDCYIISYSEEQEPPEKPVRVKVRIFKDESRVEMSRAGEVSSLLIIEKSTRNLCQYGTAFGEILMGISGQNIENIVLKDEGTFKFEYVIDINGSITSINSITMNYRINQEN